mmetsp:Transcript_55834/g.149476  ORF Transcript_55834/g.149476 Transcript_55834/m.149476 type:complete len:258 (-) Transcript_55834:847-1620(-)
MRPRGGKGGVAAPCRAPSNSAVGGGRRLQGASRRLWVCCSVGWRALLGSGHAEALQDGGSNAVVPLGRHRCHLGHDRLAIRQRLERLLQLLKLLGGHGHGGSICKDGLRGAVLVLDLDNLELRLLLRRRRLLLLPLDEAGLLLEHALRLLLAARALRGDLDASLALRVVDGGDAAALHLEDALLLLEPLLRRRLDDASEDLAIRAALVHLLRDQLQELRHEVVVHSELHGVREDARVEQVRERAVLEAAEVRRRNAA